MLTALLLTSQVIGAAGVHVVVDVRGVPKAPAAGKTAGAVDAAAQTDATSIFQTRCAMCHGPGGQGDGPAAQGYPTRPRRFSDAVWQASVSDDDIAAVIVEGGPARKLSPLMLPNLDLKEKPAVVKALVAMVRALRSSTGSARATLHQGKSTVSASADAAADGSAHVDVPGVGPGTWSLVVESAPGAVLCRQDVKVAAADVKVTCGAGKKAAGEAAPVGGKAP